MKSRSRFTTLALVSTTLLAAISAAIAQTSGSSDIGSLSATKTGTSSGLTPSDYLRRAQDLTAIRNQGSPPFYMKLQFTAYGPVEFMGEGDYEETWLSPNQWVREVTLGAYHAVELQDRDRHAFQASSDYEPKRVLEMEKAILSNVPSVASDWKVAEDGPAQLVHAKTVEFVPVGSFEFNADGTPAKLAEAGTTTSWAHYEKFGDKFAAKSVLLSSAFGPMVKIDIMELTALPPNASLPKTSLPDARPDQSFMPFQPPQASLKPPKLTFSVDPGYPRKMRHKHQPGVVIVNFVVDKNGGVREPEPIYASDPEFISAALKSVSRFRFEAAQLGSEPVATEVNLETRFKIW